MKNGSGSVSEFFASKSSSLPSEEKTDDSETINWTSPDEIQVSKEPRFGRRIDPVLNTFENRLSQVKTLGFWLGTEIDRIFRLWRFLKKISWNKTSKTARMLHRQFKMVTGIV